MSRKLPIAVAIAGVCICVAADAMAGAKIQVDEDTSVDLGLRVQSLFVSANNTDLDGDGDFDRIEDFRVRRARIRLKGLMNEYAQAFLQSEVGSGDGGGGLDWRIIDAHVTLKANNWLQLIAGLHTAASDRQDLTSSGALLTIDRPSATNKSINRGGRGRLGFGTGSSVGDSGLRTEVGDRDAGVTLFGAGSLGDQTSLKYYLGTFDGVQAAGQDNERYTVRGQINFFDAEGKFNPRSCYLGTKKTIGLGVGLDTQTAVGATDAGELVDYTFVTADAFVEWPVAEGSLSFETGYTTLDFSQDTLNHDADDGTTAERDLAASRGNGVYAQAGYYFGGGWQPWVGYEKWTSDSDTDAGSYNLVRVGLTYFLEGQSANIKAGVEQATLEGDNTFGGVNDDSITTFVVGAFVTY